MTHLAHCDAKPAHAIQMDAVDSCLFTCDACYKVDFICLALRSGTRLTFALREHLCMYCFLFDFREKLYFCVQTPASKSTGK